MQRWVHLTRSCCSRCLCRSEVRWFTSSLRSSARRWRAATGPAKVARFARGITPPLASPGPAVVPALPLGGRGLRRAHPRAPPSLVAASRPCCVAVGRAPPANHPAPPRAPSLPWVRLPVRSVVAFVGVHGHTPTGLRSRAKPVHGCFARPIGCVGAGRALSSLRSPGALARAPLAPPWRGHQPRGGAVRGFVALLAPCPRGSGRGKSQSWRAPRAPGRRQKPPLPLPPHPYPCDARDSTNLGVSKKKWTPRGHLLELVLMRLSRLAVDVRHRSSSRSSLVRVAQHPRFAR